MFELCASILAANPENLARDVQDAETAGVDAFHIDLMDGCFVPAVSFDTRVVRAMRAMTKKPLDVHLMVDRPLNYVEELADLGVESISVHYEVPGGAEPALKAIRAAGLKAGLVLNPETSISAALPYLEQIDQLLLMTVHPGHGGQAYLSGSNEKITAARAMTQSLGSSVVIQVDGGINLKTLPGAYKAGARSIVAGSAVFCGNIQKNVLRLQSEPDLE